jgi:hypothetical protein
MCKDKVKRKSSTNLGTMLTDVVLIMTLAEKIKSGNANFSKIQNFVLSHLLPNP